MYTESMSCAAFVSSVLTILVLTDEFSISVNQSQDLAGISAQIQAD